MANFAATYKTSVAMEQVLPVSANRITAGSLPFRPAAQDRTYSSDIASGTGANGMLRYIQKGGSLVATTIDINLSTEASSDGTTGLTHYREAHIWNDSATDVLVVGLGTTPFTTAFMAGTTPTITVQPGTCWNIPPKPLGTTGYVVAGANIVRLNSGTATVAWRISFGGN